MKRSNAWKLFGLAVPALMVFAGFGTITNADDKKDVVDTAIAAGNFKTLAALLTTAELVDTLKGTGPFTVFAPTDEAFAKLPKEKLESLKKPENRAELKSILTYHVHAGKLMAADVVKAKTIKTVNGAELTVTLKDKDVMIDKSKVTKTDIGCTNGVIHVIDTVLIP